MEQLEGEHSASGTFRDPAAAISDGLPQKQWLPPKERPERAKTERKTESASKRKRNRERTEIETQNGGRMRIVHMLNVT